MAHDLPSPQGRELIAELEVAKASFHSVVDHLPDSSWIKTSANPPWTNGQVLFHITLAFILLPFLLPLARVFGRLPPILSKLFAGLLDLGTTLFNWANGLGPRAGGLVFTRTRLLKKYDSLHLYAVNNLHGLDSSELQRGMFYPRKWDPMFRDFMTLADLFRYPAMHMEHHLQHIVA
jgi:hypothetical protein